MSSPFDSDRNLVNLRDMSSLSQDSVKAEGTSSNDASPITPASTMKSIKNVSTKATKAKARPNRAKGQRISARRIGVPSYQDDLDRMRIQRAKMQSKSKSLSRSMQSKTLGVPRPHNSLSMRNAMPQPETLGGLIGRRASSKTVIQRTRTRSVSTSSRGSNQSEKNLTASGGEVIIRYGELLKKRVVEKSWSKRFFVLTDKHLFYFVHSFDVPQELTDIDVAPRGKIPLALIDDVSIDKKDPEGSVFIITTPTRNYRLKMETIQVSEEETSNKPPRNYAKIGAGQWVNTIRGACDNSRQHQGLMAIRSRGSFGSFQVDEVDYANSRASMFKHPTRRLIDSDLVIKQIPKSGNVQQSAGSVFAPAELGELPSWTPYDVAAWLHSVHMGEFAELFYKQGIDGKMLREISTTQEAKVIMGNDTDDEKVMKFLNAVEQLREVDDLPALEQGVAAREGI